MVHYRSLDQVDLNNSWLTIGVFDGVHRGHQEILANLTAGAHENGAPAVVLTFWPHPAVVLGKRNDLKSLSTPGERADLLGELGVDAVITQPFTSEFAKLSALDFMRLVSKRLGLRSLWIGYDFALGHNREGNLERLTEIGSELGYNVQAIGAVVNGEDVLSSSLIRQRIRSGDVARAAENLGRFYALSGLVVHGDGRGRRINIPTANIDYPKDKVIPANGVYATWAWVGGERYPAATNIGINPTFTPDKETPNVEAHLLDFDRDLYDQEVKLEFVEYLREELRFDSVEALLEQIHADIGKTREILK
ncbi:MAG: bifunctional riboflavin kinase/FAD synthetase [Anaerolineales bacterium]|nr:bifunctional riboflavin kinase/FAD synthetase [Anaerolineales bacterium]